MFRVTVEIYVHTEDEQQMRTAARKAKQALIDWAHKAPYRIQLKMLKAEKRIPGGVIVAPDTRILTPSELKVQ